MARQESGLPARYYIHLCEALEEQGVDVPALLEASNIPADIHSSARAVLSTEQVEQLVENALAVNKQPGIAHDLGESLKLSSHGILGFAALSSPTLGHGLKLVADYFNLIMPAFTMQYRPTPQGLQLNFLPNTPLSNACLMLHFEAIVVALHWAIRDLLQDQMPEYDVYMPYAAPAHQSRYKELKEARCHFNWEEQHGIRLLFPGHVANRPLKMADPVALKEVEALCKQQSETTKMKNKISEWVESILLEAKGNRTKLSQVAASLNISPRTLDRHLHKEGVTFRQLLKKTQYKKACKLLSSDKLSITEIAYELGFSDASNFARSFKCETGYSPQEWRELKPLKKPKNVSKTMLHSRRSEA